MKIKPYYLLMSLVLMLVSACSDDNKDEPTTIDRTVLVYIMGDNTLSHLVNADINEMIEGAANVDLSRNNLLVYMDDKTTVKLIRISKEKGTIVQELIENYDYNRNSVGLDEMKEVFSTVYKKYPAESYGLVLWSHGEGWKPGTSSSRWIGEDVGSNATLSISTLSEVMKVFPYYDYVLFDACFMQSVEVAYELRHHTDYFIGSPAEIPGPGAPYQKVVPALFAKSDAAATIARSYFEYYNDLYTGSIPLSGKPWTGGVLISVIATNGLNALAEATNDILPAVIQDKNTVPVSGILNYDRRTSGGVGYYDFDMLMKSLTNENASYTKWRNALNATVPYVNSTEKIYTAYNGGAMFDVAGYCGVSSYVPRNSSSLNQSYKTFDWYTDAGWSETGW